MNLISIYLLIGLTYSSFLLLNTLSSKRRKYREHWAGILIVGTLVWWIDLIVGHLDLVDKNYLT